jgi:hypothetical protein
LFFFLSIPEVNQYLSKLLRLIYFYLLPLYFWELIKAYKKMAFASLGNACLFICDFMLKVSNLILNSNISYSYFLTTEKFGILRLALTTEQPFDSNFTSLSRI